MNSKIFILSLLALIFCTHADAQETGEKYSVKTKLSIVNGKIIENSVTIDGKKKQINTKEITVSVSAAADGNIFIETDNDSRKIRVLPAEGNQVKIVTTAYFTEEPSLSDADWFDRLGIKIQGSDKLISIISKNIRPKSSSSSSSSTTSSTSSSSASSMSAGNNGFSNSYSYGNANTDSYSNSTNSSVSKENSSNDDNTDVRSSVTSSATYITGRTYLPDENGVTLFNGNGKPVADLPGLKREITVYLPAGANVSINSRYTDVAVTYKLSSAKMQIRNASLDMSDADILQLDTDYGNIKTGNLGDAIINLNNAKLYAKNIEKLNLSSSFSKMEAGTCGTVELKSNTDDIDIDEVSSITGSKEYGSFRLGVLTGKMDLSGSSSDLRIKKIDPSTQLVSVRNKYADVRLPLNLLKNYSVNFTGNYSKIYAPFEVNITPSVDPKSTNYNFNVSSGNMSGAVTKFDINCTNCSLDFK